MPVTLCFELLHHLLKTPYALLGHGQRDFVGRRTSWHDLLSAIGIHTWGTFPISPVLSHDDVYHVTLAVWLLPDLDSAGSDPPVQRGQRHPELFAGLGLRNQMDISPPPRQF